MAGRVAGSSEEAGRARLSGRGECGEGVRVATAPDAAGPVRVGLHCACETGPMRVRPEITCSHLSFKRLALVV